MKFLADMGISPKTVAWLRAQGHDAEHLLDRAARTARDPDILRWACDERRILLTHDLDFSDLVAASQGELPSVVVFRLRNMRPENVNRHMQILLDTYQSELKAGAIFSVREGRIRWRSIPMDPDR